MDAFEAIAKRRSVRRYKPDPVPKEFIEKIVDCGRRAPSARNVQPAAFVAVTDRANLDYLAATCPNGKFFAEAPAAIITFCKDTKYYLEDGCAAVENMLLGAAALGLGTCWVAGDKKEYADEIARHFGLPAEYKLINLMAVGYAADAASQPPKRPLAQALHWEKW